MINRQKNLPLPLLSLLLLSVLSVLTFTSNIAYASFADCQQNFYQQTPPTYRHHSSTKETYPLCFHGFAVMYSADTHTPLWSAEYLTRERVFQAGELPRQDNFHAESQLPKAIRAELEHYSGSGYDRGHLAPNADMATINQQYDSFSLANITPQSPFLNREVWKSIESATRYLTKVYDDAYVVTGAVFIGQSKKIDHTVSVPSHLFKAIYLPTTSQAGVYYAANDESGRIEVISLDELRQRTGINVMPSLEPTITDTASDLPLPNEAFQPLDTATSEQGNGAKTLQKTDDNTGSSVSENGLLSFLTLTGRWLLEFIHWIREQLSS